MYGWQDGFCLEVVELVPRPSHCSIFDRLQCSGNGGGKLSPFYHVNDVVSTLVDGGVGVWSKECVSRARSSF